MSWTPFVEAFLTEQQAAILRKAGIMPDKIWKNDAYEVWVRAGEQVDGFPRMVWMSIKRRDKGPIDENRWRILQRIKNEVIGPEHEAVELYPAESRLVDTSNQYHLWVLADPLMRWPFGFTERLVGESSSHGARQRPWDDEARPPDLKDKEIREKMDMLGVNR